MPVPARRLVQAQGKARIGGELRKRRQPGIVREPLTKARTPGTRGPMGTREELGHALVRARIAVDRKR